MSCLDHSPTPLAFSVEQVPEDRSQLTSPAAREDAGLSPAGVECHAPAYEFSQRIHRAARVPLLLNSLLSFVPP